MNTNMTGFRWLSKHLCTLVLCMKVASALKDLKQTISVEYRIQKIKFEIFEIKKTHSELLYICFLLFRQCLSILSDKKL